MQEFLEKLIGFPMSQISLVLALFGTYFLALIHNQLVSASQKHIFNISSSLLMYCVLFGVNDIAHLLISPILIYVFSAYFRSNRLYPIISFVFAMGYIACRHFYTQFLAEHILTFDGTAPLMIMVIKVTSFFWCLSDGTRPDSELSESQKALAVKKLPSLLEYFGYMFFFGGFLVGPALEFNDYMNFCLLKVHLINLETI